MVYAVRYFAAVLLLALLVGCAAPAPVVDEPGTKPSAETASPEAGNAGIEPQAKTGTAEIAPEIQLAYTLSGADPMGPGGTLLVKDSSGAVLLERTAERGLGVRDVVGLRDVGAPFPVLLIWVAGGGSMGEFYEAYLYDPEAVQLKRLAWGELPMGVSVAGVEQEGKAIKTTVRERKAEGGWQAGTRLWQYKDGALVLTAGQ